jgi:hypothetical protein
VQREGAELSVEQQVGEEEIDVALGAADVDRLVVPEDDAATDGQRLRFRRVGSEFKAQNPADGGPIILPFVNPSALMPAPRVPVFTARERDDADRHDDERGRRRDGDQPLEARGRGRRLDGLDRGRRVAERRVRDPRHDLRSADDEALRREPRGGRDRLVDGQDLRRSRGAQRDKSAFFSRVVCRRS